MDVKNYGKRYRIEHIEPGIISYEDVDAGKLLVSLDALDRMRKTFIGKPVVNEEHQTLAPNEAFKISNDDPTSWADGVVADVGRLPNGWDYTDVIIWNEETIKNIDENGFRASCSYVPTEIKDIGGRYHGIDYDEELENGVYTHMAIVANPRYEHSRVYENSKKSLGGKKVKFIKKAVNNSAKNNTDGDPKKDPKDDVKEIDIDNASVECENGEKIPMNELIETYKKDKAAQKANESQMMNAKDEIDVDGEKVSVENLMKTYNKCKKENETVDPDSTKMEDPVDKNNMSEEEKKEKEKSNSVKNSHFKLIENSSKKSAPFARQIQTKDDRIAKGNSRYGTPTSKVTEV